MDITKNWIEIKELFRRSFRSSFHYAISTVNKNGEPHITPIGSLILTEPGHGFYFEEFPHQLARNIQTNKQICVLAVNSGVIFWLSSLLRGKFVSPPAIRLYGIAGDLRPATEIEVQRWQKRVGSVSFTKGHRMIWKDMCTVRDIQFTRAEPVQIGSMTRGVW
jgi:hypothetical protein